jgi:hypothetical protein
VHKQIKDTFRNFVINTTNNSSNYLYLIINDFSAFNLYPKDSKIFCFNNFKNYFDKETLN